MSGKRSLYQRVLASPGTRLLKEPGAADAGQPVTPFTTFNVYGRREAAGQEWLEIGPDSHGKVAGFALRPAVDPVEPGFDRDLQGTGVRRARDLYLQDRPARLLEVASVPLEQGGQDAAARPFRTGIVFVMDATQSMRPYIERTRAVTRRVYEAIAGAGLRGQVSFGLTAFRDHLAHPTG